MSTTPWQDELTPILRQSQIVTGALVLGCVTFLGVAIAVPREAAPIDPNLPILTYAAVGFAVMALIVRLIVPGIIASATRRKIIAGTWRLPAHAPARIVEFVQRTGDAGKLAMAFLTRTVVAAALLEGVALVALMAYLLERSPLSLILAGAMILGLLAQVPTQGRLVAWIEEQLGLIEQERQFG